MISLVEMERYKIWKTDQPIRDNFLTGKNTVKEFFRIKKAPIMKVNFLKMKNMGKECCTLGKGNMKENLPKGNLMAKGSFIIQTETLMKEIFSIIKSMAKDS